MFSILVGSRVNLGRDKCKQRALLLLSRPHQCKHFPNLIDLPRIIFSKTSKGPICRKTILGCHESFELFWFHCKRRRDWVRVVLVLPVMGDACPVWVGQRSHLDEFPGNLVSFGFVSVGWVWFGLVWFGLVWLGLVRIGLVGLVWFGFASNGGYVSQRGWSG